MSSYPDNPRENSELERDRLLNTLLEQTLDLPESEQASYLEKNCSDPELRQEALELLNEDLGDFLEHPSPGQAGSEAQDAGGSPLMLIPLCYFSTLAIRRGDYRSARAMLEKAEQSQGLESSHPTLAHAVLHRSLGKVYQALDQIDNAKTQYRKAVNVLELLAPTKPHLKELKQARFELFQLQGFLQSGQPQSVHDFFA